MSDLHERIKSKLNAKKETVKTYGEDDNLMQIKSWIPVGEWFEQGTLGGGFPAGHITQVIGKSDSGKTTLVMEGMVKCQEAGGVVFLIDAEHKFSLGRFKKMGGKPSELMILPVESLEDAWNSIDEVCEEVEALRADGVTAPMMMVWDSLAASVPRKMLDEKDSGDSHMALEAKINNKNVRKLRQRIKNSELCCVVINHFYMTVPKTMYEQSELVTKGGEEFYFMSTLIIQVTPGKALTREFKKDGQDHKQQFGKVSKFKVIKSHIGGRSLRMEMNNVEIGLLDDEEMKEYQKSLRGKI